MASKAEKLAKKLFGIKLNANRHHDNKLAKRCKVVVFVPQERSDELAFAMASAGAGVIGNYTLCSFRSKGVGTFMGNESSHPALGSKGEFEMVEELRLEMICDKKDVEKVIQRINEVHPYDEPAYEVYEVLTGRKKQNPELLEMNFRRKLTVRYLLKKINPGIIIADIPGKMKNIKIGKCIIDCTDNEDEYPDAADGKTIYLKKNKKNIKAYLI